MKCSKPARRALSLAWIVTLFFGTGAIPAFVAAAPPTATGTLAAGAATVEITPEIGGKIVGGFQPVPSERIHDPLRVRCLVLDDGRRKLAVVVCDLLGIHRAVSDQARRRIEERTGIPRDNVLVCATHTHSATSAIQPRFDFREGAVEKLEPYQEKVAAAIAAGVSQALARARPAVIGFGSVQAPEYVFNRRWRLRPGTMPPNPFGGIDMVKMNPGPGPHLEEPAGPTDPEVSFISLRARDGVPLAVFASYGLHYIGGVPSGDVSADYFTTFADELGKLVGGGRTEVPFVAMMANGTSGDVNNNNLKEPGPRREPYEQMRLVGTDLARRVAAALDAVAYTATVDLGSRYRELPVGCRVPTADEIKWAEETLAKPAPTDGKLDLSRAYSERVLAMRGRPAEVAVPLQVLKVGPAALATMPCEVFCEIGLEFKQKSALQPAQLISLAHGYCGYLPTVRQHRLGGYETWLGTNDLVPGAGEEMLAALVEMSSELAAEVPSPAAVGAATRVVDGYVLELAAAEPVVVDPVAITFDEQGRPYVAEYRDYPLGPPDGKPPLSRIVRLDDADGDGVYERSTVFADNLPFAQGVLAVRGGILVTGSADLLFLTDTDGDGRADRREVVATGFKVGNPQLRAACPQLDLDNSVSITGGLSGGVITKPGAPAESGVSINRRDVRIDLARGTIAAATGFGQFGNTFDDLGRRFTVSNRNPLVSIRLPAEALARNSLVDLGAGYVDAAPSGAASRVFPAIPTQATALSHAGTHTSACGLSIFRGDLLGPTDGGDAFVCEPVSHLVTRRHLEPDGASFTSRRVEPDGEEFLVSRSGWFRPVFTATGPDGALWVMDMCRGTVEHPEYMRPGVAATLDLRAGDTAGRIWRVRRDGAAPRAWRPPASAAEAVALLEDPNGWRRTTAQRLLVEGRFLEAEREVRALLARQPSGLVVVHALWTLHGLGALTAADVRGAADARDAGVRETAARLATLVDSEALAAEIAGRLQDDADPHVRLAAALAAAGSSAPAATPTLAAIGARQPHDPWIDAAVLSGAIGRAAPLLEAAAASAPAGSCDDGLVAFVERLGTTAAGSEASGQKKIAVSADAAAALRLLAGRAKAGHAGCFDVALLAGLAARISPADLAESIGAETIEAVLGRAMALATDGGAAPAVRKVAIRLLGTTARSAPPQSAIARAALLRLVGSAAAAEVQSVAAGAVVRSGDVAAIAAVVDAVAGGSLEPTVRSSAVTALADHRDGAAGLLAAIESGRVPPTVVPLDRRAALARSPDAKLREAAERVWKAAGAPGLSEQELDSLVATVRGGGDVARGKELFLRHCATCHQAGGSGHQVGPALAEAGDRPIDQIVVAIVDPNRAVEPRWESSVVVTEEGEVIEGILAESGQESIVIVRAGGERRIVPRNQIESLHSAGRSLMPEGFGRTLRPEEFADLVAFLRGGRPVPPAPAAVGATSAVAPAAAPAANAAPARAADKVAAAPAAGAAAPGRFRAGAHVEDISPTRFPVPVNGGMQQVMADGIGDPMQARCLALDDGARQFVLVVVDACMIPREIVEEAKAIAAKETGIAVERMLISATHTHSAAALTPVFQCDVDREYIATVAPRIARGIVRAVGNFEPAECGWAFSSAPDQVFHRRWFMKPGHSDENPFGGTSDVVKMNPGAVSSVVSVPAGPVDPDVAVLAVRATAGGRPIGLVANYSLHYVGGVKPISADYFAVFCTEIGRRLGAGDDRYAGKPPFVAMLSNGTSGNINNVNYALSPKHKVEAASRIRLVASAVADAAEEAYAAIAWRGDATLDSRQEQLMLGVRKGTPAEVSQARVWLESIPKNANGQWSDRKAIYARETLKLEEYPATVPVTLQVHRVGDLSIAAIPCEVFVETGLRLKRTSPFVRHFTVSLANGYNGYLPQAADHELGGYETWRARSSYLEIEAEGRIVAALERMAGAVYAREPSSKRAQ